ncbi:PIN domain-containing protein [Crocosphaera sp. XPORK-15E]|uniref:PIN domain-containing protein n=1 Tax=Crocosphaera sp. XPORK-15E TaxID=3110247 RepID=UPI002B1F1B42|nr:PIN domain-containing protein [Crocosphaera sp. XPORK-15E]MEA5532977.1 PIN domain-containing protein [Crocosphaera sp. XPORK-15E]
MTKQTKIIVLDANILIRAVLVIKTFSLIAENRGKVLFCTPQICYREVIFHIPNIARKRHISPTEEQEILKTLNKLKQVVSEIEEDIYRDFKEEALSRIRERDEKDWPIVALALAFGCPIWTEDQDFFGIGIATWKTKNIEIFFHEL